jgi:hypothetical protein
VTPLDSRIDEDFVARFYRGEPFVFEGQLEDKDGAAESLDGRTFWGCVMAADGSILHEVVAEIIDEGARQIYQGVFGGTMSDDCYGRSGLIWAQGEHLSIADKPARVIHAQGPLIIYPGPGSQAPEGLNGSAAIAHRIVRRVADTGGTTIRISQRGARGSSIWEAFGKTLPEYQSSIEDVALRAARPAIEELTQERDRSMEQTARAAAVADAAPEILEARDDVRLDADRADIAAGQASGKVTLRLAEVANQGGGNLFGYAGAANLLPIVADGNGKVLVGVDRTTGRLAGDFDVDGQLDRFYKSNVVLRGGGAQTYSGADNLVPVVVDAAGKVLVGINRQTGQAIGDFDIGGKLDTFYRSNVVLRGGGASVWTGSTDTVPLIVDAAGTILLSISRATGLISGAFDIAARVNASVLSYVAKTISPPASGLGTYIGTSAIVPVLTDANGKVLIAVNTETGSVSVAGLDVSAASSALQYKERKPLPAANRFVLSANTIYGVVAYGQSLSLGAQGRPPLSTVQRYSNLTFAAGPKTTLTGNGFRGNNQSAMDAAKPLVEDLLSPDDNTSRGETILSGMLNGAVELAAIENALPPAALSFFGSTAGHGGWSIDMLKPGYIESGATVNWYQNFLDHVTKQRDIVVSSGKTYICVAIPWLQLEADASQSKDWYKTRAAALFAQLQADVVAITGQTAKPHIISYQPPFGARNGATGGEPGAGPHRALLELSLENPDIHVVPSDGLPYYTADNTHWTNLGYLWGGWRFARVLKDIVVDGLNPEAIAPISAVVRGSLIKIKFSVPVGPLVIDTTTLAPTQDAGFKVVSVIGGNVTPSTITAVYVEGGDTIVLSLASEPGANAVVRCGMDYLGAGLGINGGATHNIRDSYPGTFKKAGVSYPLWNVAPHFQINAISLDAGA